MLLPFRKVLNPPLHPFIHSSHCCVVNMLPNYLPTYLTYLPTFPTYLHTYHLCEHSYEHSSTCLERLHVHINQAPQDATPEPTSQKKWPIQAKMNKTSWQAPKPKYPAEEDVCICMFVCPSIRVDTVLFENYSYCFAGSCYHLTVLP